MPERARLVAAAAKRWQEALVDDSGRNQLAYYRELKAGTLNLVDAKPEALAQLLAGVAVNLKTLFPDVDIRKDALRRVRAIRKQMRVWAEERGVEVGYVASGMATWEEIARNPHAPVLLQQLSIRPSSLAETDFVLKADAEPSVNPVLLHKLEKDFGLVISAEELLDLDQEELYQRMRKLAIDVPRFAIHPGHLVGTFTYAKLPMVDDIREHLDALTGHEIIAALAGDKEALDSLASGAVIGLDEPDHVVPADEYLVLDADSSQNYAVNAVVSGQHLVIKGPPGTGKSQTIANIIAALAARGRSALFVAEKRAAIDAVLDRLEQVGLDDLVYNLHGEQTSRRELARSLEMRLHRARTEARPNAIDTDHRLLATRSPLIAHHDAMHQLHEPWGVSAFIVQAYLMGMPPEAKSQTRWKGAELQALHGEFAEQVGSAILELAQIPVKGPWEASKVLDNMAAQEAFELAGVAAKQWVQARQAVAKLTAELGLRPIGTPTEARAVVQLATEVNYTLSRMKDNCYTTDFGGWEGFWQKRRTTKQLKELWLARKKPKREALQKTAQAIADQKERWAKLSVDGKPPRWSATLTDAQQALGPTLETLQRLHAHAPVHEMELHLETMASDQQNLLNSVRRNELRAFLEPWKVESLLDGPPELADQRFTYAWLQSILDHLRFKDEHLGRFYGAALHTQSAQYRQADKDHLVTAAARVRYQAAMKMIEVLDRYPDQQRLVRSEASKKTRHMPVRRLFEQAPDALMALKPCWAMSPLLASQVLPARNLFDVVIFDEASQVEPVDAITAIMRGKQVVVAGDEHQLPPTAFFQRTVDEEGEYDEDHDGLLTEDIESLLQAFANALPLSQVKHLAWHYRSRDERLIAFSNAHIYAPNGNPLVTFPGAEKDESLRHVLVTHGSEVERVVKLVIEHAQKRPDESLGVITMSLKHAEAIDSALRQALEKKTGLNKFFSESNVEPFFVKSIERVQGDERDAIILSVGYSRKLDGRMAYRFGPLNNRGGERRLNVAVTRAKHRTTVVSTFRHVDLDPNRLRSYGAKLLGAYLEYAATGGQSLAGRLHGTVTLSPFEVDVRDRLTEAGVPVVAQYGVSGFRIDFAAHHPEDPSRVVLAIETDGASYHASPTVRDRERLRQQHLERLGWRYHRIWSTDWFTKRENEISRAVVAYQEALAAPARGAIEVAAAQPEATLAGTPRGPRPELGDYQEIGDLPEHVLAELVAWIESDGLNRTEAEVVAETINELGFQRRGTRIVDAVVRARRTSRPVMPIGQE